jgi:hypothetical protein
MTMFPFDPRVSSSLALAEAQGNKPCGCRWRLYGGRPLREVSDPERATHADLAQVCVMHRRWLGAIFIDQKKPPNFSHPPPGGLPLVGPAYQSAIGVPGGGGGVTMQPSIAGAAVPEQVGNVAQVDGPLHQASRDVARIEEAHENLLPKGAGGKPEKK